MIRLLYNLLWPVGLLLFLPGYLLKMWRRGGYRKNFGERFAFYASSTKERLAASRPVWLHAVSVGEVAIALKLARQLRLRRPDLPLLLTTTTTTGHALAQKSASEWLQVLYAPLDFWPVMRVAFRRIRPERIVLIEGEVWPNLVAEAKRARRRVVLASARLSPRSEARFQRFRHFIAPLFRQLDLVCVADERDAQRWRDLGARHVRVVGNIKYDADDAPAVSADLLREEVGLSPHRPVLLAGSTHRGEEEIVVDSYLELRAEFPDLFLILAPRHVERALEVERIVQGRGLCVTRRSSPGKSDGHCLLLDTTGELRAWYAVASVVFIGKSISRHGGQNPVEAILAGKPVLFGPHMENFAGLTRDLLAQGGAVQVETTRDLCREAGRLLREPDLRNQMSEAAHQVVLPHDGASARTAAAVAEIGGSPALTHLQAAAALR